VISALAFNRHANLSLTQNQDVLGLYTDRLGRIRTKPATELTFRSPRLNAGGRSLKSFAGVFSQLRPRVCLTASAQDVQSKRLFATCALGIMVLLFPHFR
ncbi:hypothetical protein P692DRAFT_20756514, partial [Suillus brevipes Sb2]